MRVFEETIAPSGKKRILFAVGIEDVKILAGLVSKAKIYTPQVEGNEAIIDIHHRLHSMAREFGKYLHGHKDSKSNPKTNPCPFCERKLRGDRALEAHIHKVHTKEDHEG